jgi:peptidoglycan/xylan/chitin deacetylase (PgdA/CDA1 family)
MNAWPLAAGIAAGAALLTHGMYSPNSSLFGRVIGRGPRVGKLLFLTFDDGPSPSATEQILDTLDRECVPAAFFMVGEHARLMQALTRAVAHAGHEVGNHTQNHAKLNFSGPRRVAEEIGRAHATLAEITGRVPRAFRAPHGCRSPFVDTVAHRYRYDVFGWTFGVWDSDRPGSEEIRRRFRVGVRPGAIVLLHDGDGYDPLGDRSQTADALPGIISDAREAGYSFRSLRELLSDEVAES